MNVAGKGRITGGDGQQVGRQLAKARAVVSGSSLKVCVNNRGDRGENLITGTLVRAT
ncbi:hypothetical protein MYCOZU1_05977 (plasmid) [Mycobacterium intracellulare subsp. chimaera]|nr:hypothetical protein MYCOZU1_05977 [Mycobacterium intracellulare subsp. chimaera]